MHPLTFNLLKKEKVSHFDVAKRKLKNSLWQQVISKKRKKIFNRLENKKLLFNFSETLVDGPLAKNELNLDLLKDKLAHFILEYNEANKVEKLYQQYILGNELNERSYRSFYNKLSAKIEVLKIISVDKGKNIALVPNLIAKLLCLLTYSVEMASSHILRTLGASARHGINKVSELRKIRSCKNKLAHCITDYKFISLLSILLTKIHTLDIPQQKNLDSFIDKHFLNFWSLFKKQAKLSPNTENLNGFWSTCLFTYFKELNSPSLQQNFEYCLNNMIETLQDVNCSAQLKNSMAINPENHIDFLQLFTSQTTAVQGYIIHVLEQLIQAANAAQSCDSLSHFSATNNGFWQKNNAGLDALAPAARYAKFAPGLIACH
ncbi:MAG: hypothetical protein RLZZ225_1042 [Pseudomonadota bacterium]|jgi:hypothetical protein